MREESQAHWADQRGHVGAHVPTEACHRVAKGSCLGLKEKELKPKRE